MLGVRLDQKLDEQLSLLAQKTGRTKSYYVKEALTEYLQDRADYFLALAELERNDQRIPISEVRRELGLER